MSKTVQIPAELFYGLCRYHLLPADSLEEWEEVELLQAIKTGLEAKLEALERRELYSQYKDTSLSEEARQKARKAYLDSVGMREGYRWASLEPPK